MKRLLIILLCVIFITACSNNNNNGLITYTEAKEKIINENAVLIDVRTEAEFTANHIDGAILYTLDNINEDTINNVIENKEAPIIVYCQSGNRSSQAKTKLEN